MRSSTRAQRIGLLPVSLDRLFSRARFDCFAAMTDDRLKAAGQRTGAMVCWCVRHVLAAKLPDLAGNGGWWGA